MVTVEDASGFRGEAARVFTPASEAELLEIIAEQVPLTIVGARTASQASTAHNRPNSNGAGMSIHHRPSASVTVSSTVSWIRPTK